VYLRSPLTDSTRVGLMAVRMLGPLTVTGVQGDVVHIGGGTAVNADHFPKGSVVCVPVPAAAGDAGPFAEVIAEVIRDHLNQHHRPLNLPLSDPIDQCAPWNEDDDIQDPRHLPSPLFFRQKPFTAWIIGLYEGASRYRCGIFRPAGVCMMRARHVPNRDPRTGQKVPNAGDAYRFCFACQYALVDVIDARLHRRLDEELIDPFYPLRSAP
jgi:hypothetical protein